MARRARTARKAWFVYMLACRGGRIYTGITTPDVRARFEKHKAGKGGAFTRGHPPIRILASLRCADRGAALKLEYALKQLAPADKRRWARAHPWRARAVVPATAGIR